MVSAEELAARMVVKQITAIVERERANWWTARSSAVLSSTGVGLRIWHNPGARTEEIDLTLHGVIILRWDWPHYHKPAPLAALGIERLEAVLASIPLIYEAACCGNCALRPKVEDALQQFVSWDHEHRSQRT